MPSYVDYCLYIRESNFLHLASTIVTQDKIIKYPNKTCYLL